jgi:hypothetical protein
MQNTTKEHMKKFAQWAKGQKIPSKTDTQVEEQGKTNIWPFSVVNTYYAGKFKLVVRDTIFSHKKQR